MHFSTSTALLISAVLVGLSALFVASEFALVAARRYRLEEAASSSRAAQAALRSSRELSILLAGCQLGITLCTLGLGAIAEPAVHHALTPTLEGWGLPEASADVVAFLLALLAITFVHLVVGEMAPKSWAIAHPERSATLLALPMRGFLWLTRPALVTLNGMANWCLRRVHVDPVDEVATSHTASDLQHLVEHSAEVGLLDAEDRDQLSAALEINTAPVGGLVRPAQQVAGVAPTATAGEIRAASHRTGHLRLVVLDNTRPVGVVHVRDTLAASPATTAADLMRAVPTVAASTPIYAALSTMRERRSHLTLVESNGELLGLVTLHDLLDRLLPPESATAAPGAHH